MASLTIPTNDFEPIESDFTVGYDRKVKAPRLTIYHEHDGPVEVIVSRGLSGQPLEEIARQQHEGSPVVIVDRFYTRDGLVQRDQTYDYGVVVSAVEA